MSHKSVLLALRERLRSLGADGIVRRTALLSGGVAIGQLALLLSTPILTRLCSPEAFGLFGVLYTIVTLFGVVGLLQLEPDLSLCKEEDVPTALLAQLTIGFVMVALLSLALFLWRAYGSAPFAIPSWADWLLPLGGLLQLAVLPLSYLHVRHRAYATYARQRMNRLLGQAAGQLVFAGFGLGALGLWLGLLCGQLAALATGWRSLVPDLRRIRPHHFRYFVPYLRRAHQYPLWVLPSALFGTASQQLPPLLAALVFSPAEAGLLLLVQRVFLLPIRLLSHAVSQAILGELRDMEPAMVRRTTWRCSAIFSALGLGLVLIALLPGTHGWTLLLGPGWEPFWTLIAYLSPVYLVTFVSEAIRTVFVFAAKRLLFLQSTLGVILTMIWFALPLIMPVDFATVVLAYSFSSAIAQAMVLILLFITLARAGAADAAKAGWTDAAKAARADGGLRAMVERRVQP